MTLFFSEHLSSFSGVLLRSFFSKHQHGVDRTRSVLFLFSTSSDRLFPLPVRGRPTPIFQVLTKFVRINEERGKVPVFQSFFTLQHAGEVAYVAWSIWCYWGLYICSACRLCPLKLTHPPTSAPMMVAGWGQGQLLLCGRGAARLVCLALALRFLVLCVRTIIPRKPARGRRNPTETLQWQRQTWPPWFTCANRIMIGRAPRKSK